MDLLVMVVIVFVVTIDWALIWLKQGNSCLPDLIR
jgi:hypothetical protein